MPHMSGQGGFGGNAGGGFGGLGGLGGFRPDQAQQGGYGGQGGFQGFQTQYGNPGMNQWGQGSAQQIQQMPFTYSGYSQNQPQQQQQWSPYNEWPGGMILQSPGGQQGGYGMPNPGTQQQGGQMGSIDRNPVGGQSLGGPNTGPNPGQYTNDSWQDIFGTPRPGGTPTPPPETTQMDAITKMILQNQYQGMQGGVGGQPQFVQGLMDSGMGTQDIASMLGLNIARFNSTGEDAITPEQALMRRANWQQKNQAKKYGGFGGGGGFSGVGGSGPGGGGGFGGVSV